MTQEFLSDREIEGPQWDPRFRPCCPVQTSTGRVTVVSLLDLLRMADPESASGGEYAVALSCATPGETVALMEYLLALCYASGLRPKSELEWIEWVNGARSLRSVAEWLEKQPGDEWNLFHPNKPLGQNHLLSSYIDEHGAGPALLVLEQSGNYNQFFDHHHLDHPEPLPADAAFRAMLAQHAYGPGGRAKIPGKSTLGPTLTNLSVGRLVGRVRVLALGASLGDTLRLNMAPGDSTRTYRLSPRGHLNRTWKDAPERRRDFDHKPPPRPVHDLADLHTALGRSILLRPARTPEGAAVTAEDGQPVVDRVLVAAGEILDAQAPELMQDAAYITTPKGERKPLWPSLSRALWREAHALYASSAERTTEDGEDDKHHLYGRLARLSERPLRLWAVGLITNQSSALAWVADSFPLIPGREQQLRYAALRGSAIAEYVARSLGRAAHAAWKVAYPNPKPSDKKQQVARFDAQPEHWAHAADPFHLLLEEAAVCEPPHSPMEAVDEYAATLAAASGRFLRQRLDALPENSAGFHTRWDAFRVLDEQLHSAQAPEELRKTPRMTLFDPQAPASDESRRLVLWPERFARVFSRRDG